MKDTRTSSSKHTITNDNMRYIRSTWLLKSAIESNRNRTCGINRKLKSNTNNGVYYYYYK